MKKLFQEDQKADRVQWNRDFSGKLRHARVAGTPRLHRMSGKKLNEQDK